MVNFVATTRRRYDRGNPRDAGECDACRMVLGYILVSSKELAFFYFYDKIQVEINKPAGKEAFREKTKTYYSNNCCSNSYHRWDNFVEIMLSTKSSTP